MSFLGFGEAQGKTILTEIKRTEKRRGAVGQNHLPKGTKPTLWPLLGRWVTHLVRQEAPGWVFSCIQILENEMLLLRKGEEDRF